MKISSVTGSSIAHTLNSDQEAAPVLQAAQHAYLGLMKTLGHIGTAIALGESGDLEAAHAYREKNTGQ